MKKIAVRFRAKLKEWARDQVPLPTAFVCANDHIAHLVMTVLEESGVSIPADCSVTGFDNLDFGRSLATVQVLKESVGERAVSQLFWRLKIAISTGKNSYFRRYNYSAICRTAAY